MGKTSLWSERSTPRLGGWTSHKNILFLVSPQRLSGRGSGGGGGVCRQITPSFSLLINKRAINVKQYNNGIKVTGLLKGSLKERMGEIEAIQLTPGFGEHSPGASWAPTRPFSALLKRHKAMLGERLKLLISKVSEVTLS